MIIVWCHSMTEDLLKINGALILVRFLLTMDV